MGFLFTVGTVAVIIFLIIRNNPDKFPNQAQYFPNKALEVNRPVVFRKTRSIGDLILDEKNDLFKLKGVSRKTFNSEDIIKYDLNEDGQAVMSGGLSIGKAVVGTVFAGPIGTVLGGLTGKRKSRDIVTDMHVSVTMRGMNSGYYKVPLITKKTKKNSKDYKNKLEEARNMMATFDILIDKFQ